MIGANPVAELMRKQREHLEAQAAQLPIDIGWHHRTSISIQVEAEADAALVQLDMDLLTDSPEDSERRRLLLRKKQGLLALAACRQRFSDMNVERCEAQLAQIRQTIADMDRQIELPAGVTM